ncbi:hypothetical protein BRC97_05855 [Halobacteriales archaeon QS_6_71_20]|nr:MAG: hypothetical protein BRC97_05855 [Halobacteriales archaeon QS_6_71_20]
MIAVRDLVVSRGGERVLDGVSLRVDRGELVGLVGPNGAGKTTLVSACNGTLAPDAGVIELNGRDLTTLSHRETARVVATVPQETNTAFEFSVEAVVEMGRTAYVSRFGTTTAADREAVRRAMERAEVAEFADRSVTTLSGGERQRVLLARALAAGTPALLLDEPTASLDINHQLRTLELVRAAVDGGKAALAAIHDLDLAARVCDRLAFVNDDPAVGSPMVTALRDGQRGRSLGGTAGGGDRVDADGDSGDGSDDRDDGGSDHAGADDGDDDRAGDNDGGDGDRAPEPDR